MGTRPLLGTLSLLALAVLAPARVVATSLPLVPSSPRNTIVAAADGFDVALTDGALCGVEHTVGPSHEEFVLRDAERPLDVRVSFTRHGAAAVKQLLSVTNGAADARTVTLTLGHRVLGSSVQRVGASRLLFPLADGQCLSYDYTDVAYERHHVALHPQPQGTRVTLTLQLDVASGETRVIDPIFDLNDPSSYLIRYAGENGTDGGFELGRAIATGDLNGDGAGDIAIGAPLADFNGQNSGSVYVILGGAAIGTGTPDLSSPTSYTARIDGAGPNHMLGTSLAAINVGGGASADLIMGAPGAGFNNRPGSGSVYVRFGVTPFPSGHFNLWAPGQFDVRLDGGAPGDALGTAVHAADLNGGGADLLMGAPTADSAGADSGSVYVRFGAVGAGTFDLAIAASFDIRYDGAASGDQLGSALASIDTNNDTFQDIGIGAPQADFNSRTNSGSVYTRLGAAVLPTGTISLASSLNYTTRFDGAGFGDRLGSAIVGLQFNGGAIGDFVLGAPQADFNGRIDSGSAYLVVGPLVPGNSDLSVVVNFARRYDGAAAGDRAGSALATTAYNQGAFDDVLIGAPGADLNSRADSGTAYAILGSAAGAIPLFDLAVASSYNQRYEGAAAGDRLGEGLGAGPINGDVRGDWLIGAPGADLGSRDSSGSVYAKFGVNNPPPGNLDLANATNFDIRYGGSAGGAQAGDAIATGDVNGDGIADIVIGAPAADFNGRVNSGSVYVQLGGSLATGDIDFSTPSTYTLRIDGAAGTHALGASVAVGDINGDGVGDLALGAPGADLLARIDCGGVYVIFGSAAFPTGTRDLNVTANWNIRCVGATAGDALGGAVAIGEATGDAVRELAMGATGFDGGASEGGALYVIFGAIAPGSRDLAISSQFSLRYDGRTASEQVGASVSLASGNLSFGATGADFNGRADSGSVYVAVGPLTGSPSIRPLDDALQYTARFDGATAGDGLGASLASGDINGAAPSELAMGAPGADFNGRPNSGSVYAVSGVPTGNRDLSSPAEYTVRYDGAAAGNALGTTLATGLVDAGTVADLAMGAPLAGFNARPGSGSAYLKLGSVALPTGNIDLSVPANFDDRYDGWQAGARAGQGLATGNVDGSASAELLIGSPLARPPNAGFAQKGLVYVVNKSNNPAAAPVIVGQFRTDGVTVIAVGGSTPELSVIMRATISDPDGSTVRLQIEVRPIGAAFTGVFTAQSGFFPSGSTVDVTATGLLSGTSYHWQARAVDSGGAAGPWVSFGGNPETAPDFTVNATLVAMAIPAQARPSGQIIPVGGFTNTSDVVFSAVVSSPTAANVQLQIEVRPLGTPFTGTPTSTSGFVPSGSLISLTASGLADATGYHWQAQGVDAGTLVSGWIAFGGNPETSPDFIVDLTSPPAPTPLVPASGTTITNANVLLDWTDVSDFSGVLYEVEIDNASDFSSSLVASNLTVSSHALPLPVGSGTYYWRARTTDLAGNVGAYSSVFTFTLIALSQGALTLSRGPRSLPNTNQLASAANVVVVQILAAASPGEDVRLRSVRFTASGTGNDATGVSNVSLYRDGNGDGALSSSDTLLGTGTYGADNGTVLFDNLNEVIAAGQSRLYLITQSFSGSPSPGETFRTEIASALNVHATGVASGGDVQVSGPPLVSSTITVVDPTTSALLIAASGPNSPVGRFVLAGEPSVSMLQVVWYVTSLEAVSILQLTLHASGSINDAIDISSVQLVIDADENGIFTPGVDPPVGTPQSYAADNGTVTFSGLGQVIPAGGSAKWLVLYSLSGSASLGQTVGVDFIANVDVLALGLSSGSFVPVTGGTIAGATHTIGAAGTVPSTLFVRGLPYPAQNAAPSSQDVVMLRARMTASLVESVRIVEATVKISGCGERCHRHNRSRDCGGRERQRTLRRRRIRGRAPPESLRRRERRGDVRGARVRRARG